MRLHFNLSDEITFSAQRKQNNSEKEPRTLLASSGYSPKWHYAEAEEKNL